jgi:carbonic anhydrase/acetyltransferase-like protein (isoleucine patch superfamily)
VHQLFTLPYGAVSPAFAGPPEVLGSRAAVLGRATIGSGASFGTAALIRADGHFVRIGDAFHLGDHATVHIAHDVYPTIVGHRVTVGANAVVHACTLGSDIVVGDGAVILDGSVLADGVALAAGSIVFPSSQLSGGQLYAGSPAKPVRPLSPGDLQSRAAEIRGRTPGLAGNAPPLTDRFDESVFVAATASLRGAIALAQNSSIWFSCELDANGGEVTIGLNVNIQDNTIIRCRPGRRFEIGEDSTVGHNVTLADCRIGQRSLIGIGSIVAPGTIVEDDVLLAAGSHTTEGQVLESGFLWGKRPAQKMARLDEGKRQLIASTAVTYRAYAQSFRQAQAAAAEADEIRR